MKEQSKKEIKSVIDAINKKMKTEIVSYGVSTEVVPCEVIPSSSISLDYAMVVGGYPVGRLIEIAGGNSVGKTHIALHAMINCQKMGGTVAYVDLESSLDLIRFEQLGLDVDNLLIAEADYLEQGLNLMAAIAPVADLVVLDSVGTITKAEYEGSSEDNHMGGRAKRLTQTTPKLATLCRQHETTMIFINQKRDALSTYPTADSDNTPGGNNFRHMMSMRIFVRRGSAIKNGEEIIGHMIKAEIAKNKVGPPRRKCEIPFLYATGVSGEWDLLNVAIDLGLIIQKGAWYKDKDGSTIGNGGLNAMQFLIDNPEYTKTLEDEIRKSLFVSN